MGVTANHQPPHEVTCILCSSQRSRGGGWWLAATLVKPLKSPLEEIGHHAPPRDPLLATSLLHEIAGIESATPRNLIAPFLEIGVLGDVEPLLPVNLTGRFP
ncbi:hypothetical protein CRG98_039464 [Punica granatum]|uniref:Uncharacterized protein n=1 Tax=Punica granatum TaxID=22663 RepID=A0A2I0I9V1_PUNGR|nr:hypothetical protein CRG98_039464 [Punica granatum]